jgi:hypothetical protein
VTPTTSSPATPFNIGGPYHRVVRATDPSWHRTDVTALDLLDDPEAQSIPRLVGKRSVDTVAGSGEPSDVT